MLGLVAFQSYIVLLILPMGEIRRKKGRILLEERRRNKEKKRRAERERRDCRSLLIIHRTRTNARACFQRQTSLKIQAAGRKVLLISFTLICKVTFQ